ncbi:MAG: U32 family peptidase [Paludibacter sp.]|nr:U32 family peptidase [Paludibacter sp.]
MREIELLAPAKNLACGIAAVDHGADAVYIGASQFGARAAAGNSIEDIATLVAYAHRFGVKVYVALNTVLTDAQLPLAEKLIWDIYHAGADALIIQDMGILKFNLPPVVLHASTQTDNRTPQKVKFLQDAGISRVVLARELSLKQINEIASQTSVELEAFVHGSLCVSYSGQCYMSEAMSGRSANRGECAQYCRLPYQLYDADGNRLARSKHLLSLKDLDLSEHLEELMEAGVTSFKIEGRLKEVDYVKNITAYYRKKLDEIIHHQAEKKYVQASSGATTFFFEPDPEKSFRRSSTDYFLNGRHHGIIQPETPKSLGEPLGLVRFTGNNYIDIMTEKELHNGDGLCFINAQGELVGFKVNRAEHKRVYPFEMPRIDNGTLVYRNQDHEFDKQLKAKTAERKIKIHLHFTETADGFSIKVADETGHEITSAFLCKKEPARNAGGVHKNIINQLSKSGNTMFEVGNVTIDITQAWFFPSSVLNEWRRISFKNFENHLLSSYVREKPRQAVAATYPEEKLSYLGNVTNKLSEQFYREHGVKEVSPGFEVKAEKGVPLMYTKHCIKYEMGWCPREGNKSTVKEPLFLENNGQKFRLSFDCVRCEMQIAKNE